MINIEKKEECCGCYACINICPKKCINMSRDVEGFNYPQIDITKCIGCNLCEQVCPVKNNIKNNDTIKSCAYASVNKDNEIRVKSSSGGIFSILCEYVINKNGVVFGASFDDKFNVNHSYEESLSQCSKFRGSKYVQSEIGYMYKTARNFLELGKLVLFTGTQCQIKGLNLYLGKKYKNLITVDVICHGVPSPKVFKLYKNKLIKKYKSDIKSISFRDKSEGWRDFNYVTQFSNGQVYSKSLKEDIYIKGFLHNLYLRPSCYECRAKNFTSGSDISLADYWGVEEIHKDLDDNKGTSLVLINTKNGQDVFKAISNKVIYEHTDLEYSIEKNPCIVKPVNKNPDRKAFFRKIDNSDIEKNINKYINKTIIDRIRIKIAININKLTKVD